MDNYNFTKGKWKIEFLCDENSIRASLNKGSIDVWADMNGETIEEANANALLISRAPEMLEKLSEIVNILDIKCTDGCVNKTWGDFQNGNGEDVGLEIDKFIKDTEQLIKEATEL